MGALFKWTHIYHKDDIDNSGMLTKQEQASVFSGEEA